MFVCYEYSKVLKWKLWMCRMNFEKKICQKFLNELCIWGTTLKIPLFFGAYFNGNSTFVVSTWETLQAFRDPLQDPAPTFSNTNFSHFWYKITKSSRHIAEYGQNRRNFDDIPQMSKYCPILRRSGANEAQQQENGLRICATHRKIVQDLYFDHNAFSKFFNLNWATHKRHK